MIQYFPPTMAYKGKCAPSLYTAGSYWKLRWGRPSSPTFPTFPQARQWCRLQVRVNSLVQTIHIVALVSGIQIGAFDPRGLASSLFSGSACGRMTSDYLTHVASDHALWSAVVAHNADGIIKDMGWRTGLLYFSCSQDIKISYIPPIL